MRTLKRSECKVVTYKDGRKVVLRDVPKERVADLLDEMESRQRRIENQKVRKGETVVGCTDIGRYALRLRQAWNYEKRQINARWKKRMEREVRKAVENAGSFL